MLGRHGGQGEKGEVSKRPHIKEILMNGEARRSFSKQTANESRGHLNIHPGPQAWLTLKSSVRLAFSIIIAKESCS